MNELMPRTRRSGRIVEEVLAGPQLHDGCGLASLPKSKARRRGRRAVTAAEEKLPGGSNAPGTRLAHAQLIDPSCSGRPSARRVHEVGLVAVQGIRDAPARQTGAAVAQ
jgi:hypothetical protein